MQDRFKFRLWNGNEMHYNDFVVTSTGFVGKITEEFLGNCVFNQQDLSADKDCKIMQCTGLKDKNDKLIYEGDIVKREPDIAQVKYDDETASFYLKWEHTETYIDDCKVIGNIYETPELLEKE